MKMKTKIVLTNIMIALFICYVVLEAIIRSMTGLFAFKFLFDYIKNM